MAWLCQLRLAKNFPQIHRTSRRRTSSDSGKVRRTSCWASKAPGDLWKSSKKTMELMESRNFSWLVHWFWNFVAVSFTVRLGAAWSMSRWWSLAAKERPKRAGFGPLAMCTLTVNLHFRSTPALHDGSIWSEKHVAFPGRSHPETDHSILEPSRPQGHIEGPQHMDCYIFDQIWVELFSKPAIFRNWKCQSRCVISTSHQGHARAWKATLQLSLAHSGFTHKESTAFHRKSVGWMIPYMALPQHPIWFAM